MSFIYSVCYHITSPWAISPNPLISPITPLNSWPTPSTLTTSTHTFLSTIHSITTIEATGFGAATENVEVTILDSLP